MNGFACHLITKSIEVFSWKTTSNNGHIEVFKYHGSRDRMWSPINWSKCKTFNWCSLLIPKFYWSNFGYCCKATVMITTLSLYNFLGLNITQLTASSQRYYV